MTRRHYRVVTTKFVTCCHCQRPRVTLCTLLVTCLGIIVTLYCVQQNDNLHPPLLAAVGGDAVSERTLFRSLWFLSDGSTLHPARTTTPIKRKASSSDTTTNSTSLITQPFLPCDWKIEDIPRQQHRTQAFLDCSYGKIPGILFEEVLSNSTTPATTTLVVSSEDTSCLKRVIERQCYDVNTRVPRLAHYVWFGERRAMPFHFFVGVLSVVRFLRPCLVLFHGEETPSGVYWEALLQLVPNILHLPRPRPREIFGHAISVTEHSADVTRLRVLLEYGGVYVDTDQYLLRPVTDLLTHSVTIGTERPGENCGNGLIFCEPEAPFLKLWLSRYSTFDDSVWAGHSTVVPYNLSLEYPSLVHVVDSFFRPNYMHLQPLYTVGEQYNWDGLHGLHLYHRFFHGYFDTAPTMDRRTSVIGDMTRHILYGSSDRCYPESKSDGG